MSKHKQKLFELISQEEVVLFVGAGMSHYAGYPSGAGLSRLIYDGLTPAIKNQIIFTEDLPKLSDDVFYLEGLGRKYLMSILEREFQKEPIKTDSHDLLAKIPHFKTIITTNYDGLIENTNKNIEVIRNSKDYANADSKKQFLFKIHGDLKEVDRIILTKTDYNKYFSDSQEDTIFWNAVKDKLAANCILFLGYSLEDSNIDVIIEKIIKQLGPSRKKMFFIGPSISKSKEGYLKKKKIEFIKSKGENFILELFDYLRINYFPGLLKGVGTANTALSFAKSNNLKLNIGSNNENYEIITVPDLQPNVSFKFKVNDNDRRLEDFIEGRSFEDIIIQGEWIKELSEYYKDFRIRSFEELKQLIIKKTPSITGPIDIHFEDGSVVENIRFDLYVAKPSKDELIFKIITTNFTLKLSLFSNNNNVDFPTINVIIEPKDSISDTYSSLKFYKLFYRLFSNEKYTIIKENKLLFTSRLNFFDKKEDTNRLFEYLKSLKRIEDYYKIRFENIKLNEINEESVENILGYIEKTTIERTSPEISLPRGAIGILDLLKENEIRQLMIGGNIRINEEIHGVSLDIGIQHDFINDAYIANWREIKNSNAKKIKIKSKSGILLRQFLEKELKLDE